MIDKNNGEFSSFEDELRTLVPVSAPINEAQAMYACGYQAGLAAAGKSPHHAQTNLPANNSIQRWTPLLLAACISCIVIGPTGYLLGRHNGLESQTSLILASNPQTEQASVDSEPVQPKSESLSENNLQPAPSSSTEIQQSTITTSSSETRLNTRTPGYFSQSQSAFPARLTKILTAWLGNPVKSENSDFASPYRYLTSRTIQNPHSPYGFMSPLESYEATIHSREITIPGDSDSPEVPKFETNGAAKRQQLGYLESLRNISTNAQNPSLLQWLN